jgi:hypothetical protein
VECCKDGFPSGRLSHLHIGTLELYQSDHWVHGHLPDKGPSSQIAQFGQAVRSRKSLGGFKLLPFKKDCSSLCSWGTSMLQKCFGTLPQIYASTQSCLSSTDDSFRPHGLVFALTCTVNCGQVCAFPNHVQSIEFTTGGLQSSCRNISSMINGNMIHLSSI